MYKKYIKRPLRIFTKGKKPYIIYKDKKYNIKSTEIKDMLKFINKLQKKTNKKVSTDNKKKKDIKNYINEKIKLVGGPITSTIQPQIQTQNLEKDTFLINKLNEKIEKDKIKINKINDGIKAIEEKKNDIKAIENDKIDELIVYDKKNKIYNLKTKKIIIKGDSIEDVKNKLDEGFNNLVNEQEVLNNEKDKLQSSYDELQKEKENLKIETNIQKEELKRRERELVYREQNNIKELKILLNKYTDGKINNYNTTDFTNLYNKTYDTKILKKDIGQKELIKYLIDYEDKNNIKPQIEEVKIEEVKNEEEDVVGDGRYDKDFGLWNYQIDKIMAPFKLFIKSITIEELNDMIKYIYDNDILIGGFILNIGNHWTAIYFDFKNEFVLEYYDPFGDPPKNIIIKSFKELILKLNIEVFVKFKINKIQQQDIKTSNCGWFSMYFLIMRFNNYSFKDITKYKNIKKDEQNIEELKDKYDKFGFI